MIVKIKDNINFDVLKKYGYNTLNIINEDGSKSVIHYEKDINDSSKGVKTFTYNFVRVHLDKTIHFFNRFGEVSCLQWVNDLMQDNLIDLVV